MKPLCHFVEHIAEFDREDDGHVLYVQRPWTSQSDTICVELDDETLDPVEPVPDEYEDFMMIDVVKKMLRGWRFFLDHEPTLEEDCAMLIEYRKAN